ncbi:MAG: glycosyltransferase [Actinomycetota bacterium]
MVFARSLRPLTAQRALLGGLGTKPLIMIRSDIDPGWRTRFTADIEVMPYASAVTGPSQTWIPALPQRGMIRRSAERFGRIRSVGFKGNPQNLPPFMRQRGWVQALHAMGLQWLPDTPQQGDGSDHTWHDFSETDVAVCLRAEEVGRRSWKPATKLINAWCAGAIPLVGPEPGYQDLVTPDEDGFLVASESEVIGTLRRLVNDPGLVQATERAIQQRARDFTTDAVLDQWWALLRRASEVQVSPDVLRQRRRDARRLLILTNLNRPRRRWKDSSRHSPGRPTTLAR